MKLALHWFLSALAVLITAYIVPGVMLAGFFTSLVVAVVLGVVNLTIKPILIIFTLPINVMTLGLFTLVINALVVMIVSVIVPGFIVNGFLTALIFGIVLSLVNYVLHVFA